ncbi:hypothetical protein OYT00_11255 [Microbacterium paraoxydans]|uniref:hypothetical protein n=1 Tax=Microbacterium paraoxydans TaxID=199592 RepID=UPI002285C8D3|nr:hypothetical protein [Microbacterium paraoxydans]MCZ0710578.1 hypothetical protein [Microbacterium paraoxydans]
MEQRYDNPSEYGGGDGMNYRTRAGKPRELSVADRARLMRSVGIDDSPPNAADPEEYGERLA